MNNDERNTILKAEIARMQKANDELALFVTGVRGYEAVDLMRKNAETIACLLNEIAK